MKKIAKKTETDFLPLFHPMFSQEFTTFLTVIDWVFYQMVTQFYLKYFLNYSKGSVSNPLTLPLTMTKLLFFDKFEITTVRFRKKYSYSLLNYIKKIIIIKIITKNQSPETEHGNLLFFTCRESTTTIYRSYSKL